MTEVESGNKADEQDTRLNDAFDRLEKKTVDQGMPQQGSPGKEKSPSSGGVVLAIFLSLVAIGVASYPAFLIYTQQGSDPFGSLTSRVNEIQSQAAGTAQSVQGNSDSLELLTEKLSSFEDKQGVALETLQKGLEASIVALQSKLGTTSQDWLLAEVEYLLRMANQRVLMERDPAGALALLTAADSVIANSQGLTAFSLREAMAADMAALEAVKVLDREGLYLRLSALAGQVENLVQRRLAYIPPSEPSEVVSTEEPSILTRLMALATRIGSRLASLVDYRRDEIAVTPILPPGEEYYLRQNLILKFEMAQIALLENDGQVFSRSLEESAAWIEKYFDAGDSVTLAMRAALAELMVIDVQQELPNLNASLREVRALMVEFHQGQARQ